ncbi:MAG: hypothetical protein IIB57_15790, partial [Planctomycetes bacterium]|nr:hypothetical protein [Planctomycetota bacterium]
MSRCEIVISGFGWVTPFAWGPIHRVMDELSSLRAQSRLGPGYSAVPDQVGDDCTPPGNEIKKNKGALIAAIARKKSAITPLAVVAAILFAQFVLIGAGKPAEYGRFGVFTNTALAIAAACLMCANRAKRPAVKRQLMVAFVCMWVMFGGYRYAFNFAQDSGHRGSRMLTAGFVRADLNRMRPDRDKPLEMAFLSEPAPYCCPPMDFRRVEVRLWSDWRMAMSGWPDSDSNRVILRPVDRSPVMSFSAAPHNVFDTPI